MKKLIIAGGTGFLGKVLQDYFSPKVNEIVVFSRNKQKDYKNVRFVYWDATNLGAWKNELESGDVLINLTGKSVDCRYNKANKAEILRSRVASTKVLNEAILSCETPPKHFLNSSTATIYDHSLNRPNDEYTGVIGTDFSMNVAKSWEQTFFDLDTPKTNKTALRISIVLGKSGGVFVPLRKITAWGMGGKQGHGQQMVSWLHELDYARAIHFVIDKKMDGVVNLCAPHPIRNEELMRVMRSNLKAPLGLNLPEFMLKIAAFFRGTETELLLKSRFVIPRKLLNAGFSFKFSTIDKALENLSI